MSQWIKIGNGQKSPRRNTQKTNSQTLFELIVVVEMGTLKREIKILLTAAQEQGLRSIYKKSQNQKRWLLVIKQNFKTS